MTLATFKNQQTLDLDSPTELFQQTGHSVFWLGINEDTIFRCNSYLIVDGDEGILFDPGGVGSSPLIRHRIEQIMPVSRLTALVISHQDPDIAGSLAEWLEINPDLLIITSPRTQVLLPHYGIDRFNFHDIEEFNRLRFKSGNEMQFYPAPFLHSPMAHATFDPCSGFMFTSDIFASIDADWQLVVDDFSAHADKMDLFHLEYMASNIAARGFVETIEGLSIQAFLPQHGSIISHEHVKQALDYLRNLQCGLDLTYPHLS